MNELLPYLLKSTLCLSLLYLAFRIVMRKEAFFGLNRMVLLTLVVCSIIIPLLHLPKTVKPIIQEQLLPQIQFQEIQIQSVPAIEMSAPVTTSKTIEEEKSFPWSFRQIILSIYLAGMLVSLLFFLHGIISVLLMIRKAQTIKKEGYRLFILEKDIPAFSFCRMIFISKADYNEHGTTILAHEQQHIRLGHFYDLLLMEMAKMAHWFNPIIYWLIQDLKAIHEYQADQQTLNKGIDATKYQLLIIEKGVGPQRLALANSFNHCQIKKRITMMNQSKNGKAWRWKVAIFLPLLALLLMAFGREGEKEPLVAYPQNAISNQNSIQVKDTTAKADETVLLMAEQMPQFPGGDKALREFIAKNVRYPQEATVKGIQGKVFVTYIINSLGKVTNPKIIRGVAPELDAEALRVISLMPAWSPGKEKGKPVSVSFTTPINFVLTPGPSVIIEKDASITSTNSSNIIGTWKLVSYNYGGGDELKPVSPGAERIKFITEKDFNWIHYAGKDKIVTSSAGGTYTFSGEDYTEKIEFGGQGMAGYIGNEHKFKVKISNNKMELSGELADGLRIKEVWERYQSSDNTSMNAPTPLFKIELKKDGSYIDNRMYSKEEIGKKAEAYQKNNPNAVVSLKMDENVPQERLNEIKEVLRNAKVLNVNLSSSKDNNPGNLPPPPPPRVQNKGLQIIMDGENILVKNQSTSLEQLERMITDSKAKYEFVEIITKSTNNKTIENKIKELLEKQNISYRITYNSK